MTRRLEYIITNRVIKRRCASYYGVLSEMEGTTREEASWEPIDALWQFQEPIDQFPGRRRDEDIGGLKWEKVSQDVSNEPPHGNDQLVMIKEKDKGVKINDDVRSNIVLRKKLGKKWNALSKVEKEDFMAKSKESSSKDINSIKKMNWVEFVLSYLVHGIEEFKMKQRSGVKIWVIQNEIRDCIDGNAMTMERENEEDEKFEINPKKDVIKRVDSGSLMEMDKTFQQLKTHLIDLCHGASSSSCEKVLTEFEEKYTTLKGLFIGSSGKPLRMHEEGTKNDIFSCERSLEDKDNKKGNEHYVHTLSIEKLCTEDFNRKNEDACATSIKVHIIPDENVDILPLPIKRSRRDYGKEPLRALCGYPNHVMKTRTSRERKPSKFKVSPFVHNLRKMGKRQASESIPMSICEDVVDAQSFNVLQSLVADYVFNKTLSKSELLVDFDHEHGVRGDFECLCPRENLMDVVSTYFIYTKRVLN
ncbi:hypothetical protein CK203_095364 [Vitis vinifera]|uniref:Chromo domain-containing protein n=1 Tax=Vitis vinifera TaxID=29760 RepID=A0A438BTI0_VITVI|nr:hypothetical protein CK203_095364 [Vitis vinifera]